MEQQQSRQSMPSQAPYQAPKKGYGKRPLWQWIVIYLVVGGILYYGIYYFAYAKKGASSTNNSNTTTSLPY
ncbi:MAG: hypothetical protein HY092_02285 [Candidatus Kerfeldbacteria bacterium]|nr:hypothetical protein [Candidatus Kerfeldbacteria bacterium]